MIGSYAYGFEQKQTIVTPLLASSNSKKHDQFDIDPNLNPSWLHSITKINRVDATITLENGSEWALGMFYSGVLKTWQEGDQVTLSWYEHTMFLDTMIKNYTKKVMLGVKSN